MAKGVETVEKSELFEYAQDCSGNLALDTSIIIDINLGKITTKAQVDGALAKIEADSREQFLEIEEMMEKTGQTLKV